MLPCGCAGVARYLIARLRKGALKIQLFQHLRRLSFANKDRELLLVKAAIKECFGCVRVVASSPHDIGNRCTRTLGVSFTLAFIHSGHSAADLFGCLAVLEDGLATLHCLQYPRWTSEGLTSLRVLWNGIVNDTCELLFQADKNATFIRMSARACDHVIKCALGIIELANIGDVSNRC